MDTEQNCILIRSQDGTLQEKTEQILSCRDVDNRVCITFTGNNKEYKYKKDKVIWLKNPSVLGGTLITVYHKGSAILGIEKVYDFNQYLRITFIKSRKPIVSSKQDTTIIKSALSNHITQNKFDYLKELANTIGTTQEDDSDSFLGKQYNKLNFIDPSCVLAYYLKPQRMPKTTYQPEPIFPFGFNLSQKKATLKALSSKISIIEGPPGTGKTQTILNIIANAIIFKKSVAIVSNNNSATSNVFEKLEKYGVNFVAAPLGNKDNKKLFFETQAYLYPEKLYSWKLSEEKAQDIKKSLAESSLTLEEMLGAKNELALIQQEYDSLLVENKYFDDYSRKNQLAKSFKTLFRLPSSQFIDLWAEYQLRLDQDTKSNIFYKFKNLLKYGIYSFSFYKNKHYDIITFLQSQYYITRKTELSEQITLLQTKLKDYQFETELVSYSNRSMELLKSNLANRYQGKKRKKFSADTALWKYFKDFIQEYPVVLSTTHSLRSCAEDNYLFDYVIMDEASQIDIVTGGLALSCAKNAVIVGDIKQLPNVVPNNVKQISDNIFAKSKLNTEYHYANNSILSSISSLFKDVPRTLLKEHYRCHPKIINFCNQKFYENQLVIHTQNNKTKDPLIVYKTVKGNHARGMLNQRQIDVILKEVLPAHTNKKKSIGIISPYRKQVNHIQHQVEDSSIAIDTVHKYQGREKDIIVLSTVVNIVNEFVDDPNLLNVAVSRAVNKLVVIISNSENEKNKKSNIGDLIKYIEYNNFQVIESNIYSIFDLLYSCYAHRLNEIMHTRKKVSEYESENLMNILIEKVLSQPTFLSLKVANHIPLTMLVKNTALLTEQELKFSMNEWSHIDFVIFNKLDKSAILAIEVDGYAFHENNPKQKKRDSIKDNILKKIGLPIIRFATNESQEEERLVAKLNGVLTA